MSNPMSNPNPCLTLIAPPQAISKLIKGTDLYKASDMPPHPPKPKPDPIPEVIQETVTDLEMIFTQMCLYCSENTQESPPATLAPMLAPMLAPCLAPPQLDPTPA